MNNERTIKWHKYPEENPIFSDIYIVSEKASDEYETFTSAAEYDKNRDVFYDLENVFSGKRYKLDTVIAWAELPEPYNNEDEK